jgi:hypothetical protein
MGFGLTIFPMNSTRELGNDIVYVSENRLKFDRDPKIFCQLRKLDENGNEPTIKTEALPPQMQIELSANDYAPTRTDAYGKELTYAFAKELKKLELHPNVSEFNRAIKAFIDALPDARPIILWWS